MPKWVVFLAGAATLYVLDHYVMLPHLPAGKHKPA